MRRSIALLAAAVLAATAACGEPALQSAGTTATTTTTLTTTTMTTVDRCLRDTVEGCTMVGIRFDPALPLSDALAVAASTGGTAIAVYRTDAVCVPEVSFSPVEQPGRVASRFAYVDAPGIAERRMTAANQGLAPPISGLHISQSYWDAWNAEWREARAAGVLIEGVAVWAPAGTVVDDPGVAATVTLAWRWTDSIDPGYPGELLMDSEEFPGLSRPSDPGC